MFFGLVPVNLTYFIQSGAFDAIVVFASISIGLMGVNVLLVNNYRDVNDDIDAGKHTSVVIFGRKLAASAYLINGFVAISVLSPLWLRLMMQHVWWCMLPAVAYLMIHTSNWWRLTHSDGAALNPLLGGTARAMLIFTVLLTVVLILG